MKKLRITGVVTALCFVFLYVMLVNNEKMFITLGSKLLWNIDKNAYFSSGIIFYENEYVITPSNETSTDYEYEQICKLKKALDSDGIELLYVNKPTKYLNDSIFLQYGIKSYCNGNADRFLERIDEEGINYLDLRKEITKENKNIFGMFYRTDHHWTVPSGKWGAEKISEALNEKCGFNIDTSIYSDENYTFKTTKECWLGEQGAKLRGSQIKKDDYTLVTPKFDTEYITNGHDSERGQTVGFTEAFIKDPSKCYHYNYTAKSCINNKVKDGKVLLIGDSFDMVTEPFLSLGIHQIDFIIMRDVKDVNIYETKIKGNDYDAVVVCYAPFMIGAHDDKSNANYRMFSFCG